MSNAKPLVQRDLMGDDIRSPLSKSSNGNRLPYIENSLRYSLENKYKNIMREDSSLGSLVSYVGNRTAPILRIYRYKEAFAAEFVNNFLKQFNANDTDYVYDPFSGLGTTLFTSMINSIPSMGTDMLPIANFCSRTVPLYLWLNRNELNDIWSSIAPSIEQEEPAEIASDVGIMKIAFKERQLITLQKMKSSIMNTPYPYCDMLLLAFFAILEECSLTSKDGQFLRVEKNKLTSDPFVAMKKKISQIEDDVRRFKFLYPDTDLSDLPRPEVFHADARDVSNINFREKPTIIITSPPYANRYDYTRSYSLELCFHFVKDSQELKDLRFSILRSHIESKIEAEETSPHPVVSEIVDELSLKKLNNPRIPIMILTYFIDMKKVINEWMRIMAPGGRVAMVVDNVRFEGELIPVDLILSQMASEAGFSITDIIIARHKGNSSQQMKKYGKIPVRESVVVWEKH
jgi:site-specific DNA-methyltransferase (cytosine-N4-specific)